MNIKNRIGVVYIYFFNANEWESRVFLILCGGVCRGESFVACSVIAIELVSALGYIIHNMCIAI